MKNINDMSNDELIKYKVFIEKEISSSNSAQMALKIL